MTVVIGLDSSASKPTVAQLQQAYAAGVRCWAMYMATKPAADVNLYSVATKADFDRVKAAGMGTFAFVSGWDDPVALKAQAANWGVATCLDDEGGIRASGSWVQPFLDALGGGHYGSIANTTVETSRAAFKIAAEYPGGNPPQQSWPPGYTPPGVPHGWQCLPTHQEFGCTVDRGYYDSYFATLSRPAPDPIGGPIYMGDQPYRMTIQIRAGNGWAPLPPGVDPSRVKSAVVDQQKPDQVGNYPRVPMFSGVATGPTPSGGPELVFENPPDMVEPDGGYGFTLWVATP